MPLVIVAVNPSVPRTLCAPPYLVGVALIALGVIARVWAGLPAAAPIVPDATATHTA